MRSRTSARLFAFSDHADPGMPGVWATDPVTGANGCYSFALHARPETGPEAQVEVELRVTGRHQVGNAVAAAGAALAVGLDVEAVGSALSAAGSRSRWRMEVHHRADGVTVINDSYNANPDSMRAAIATLAEFGGRGGRRTWAVLGDMLELGDSAEAEHEAIGRFVAELGIDQLVAVGEYAERLADGAEGGSRRPSIQAFDTKADALAAVTAGLAPGDVVLVKASRGLALNTVADDILAAVAPPAGPEAAS